MKHNHLNILDMQSYGFGADKQFRVCLALPSGDSAWITISEEDYDRLKVKDA